MGADGSPTERIDRIAEEEILRLLDREGVDWNFVSEEAGAVERGGRETLVVDPIDGSSNAVRGFPFTSISLALGRDTLDGIDIGVIHDLYRNSTFWAVRGEGAFRDGRRLRPRPFDPKREFLLVSLGRYSSEESLRHARRARRARSLGCASLEIASVAEGTADGYYFNSSVDERNLRATDIAAAYRILREAGGGLEDAHGRSIDDFPLGVERRTSLFAWGDPAYRAAFPERSR